MFMGTKDLLYTDENSKVSHRGIDMVRGMLAGYEDDALANISTKYCFDSALLLSSGKTVEITNELLGNIVKCRRLVNLFINCTAITSVNIKIGSKVISV